MQATCPMSMQSRDANAAAAAPVTSASRSCLRGSEPVQNIFAAVMLHLHSKFCVLFDSPAHHAINVVEECMTDLLIGPSKQTRESIRAVYRRVAAYAHRTSALGMTSMFFPMLIDAMALVQYRVTSQLMLQQGQVTALWAESLTNVMPPHQPFLKTLRMLMDMADIPPTVQGDLIARWTDTFSREFHPDHAETMISKLLMLLVYTREHIWDLPLSTAMRWVHAITMLMKPCVPVMWPWAKIVDRTLRDAASWYASRPFHSGSTAGMHPFGAAPPRIEIELAPVEPSDRGTTAGEPGKRGLQRSLSFPSEMIREIICRETQILGVLGCTPEIVKLIVLGALFIAPLPSTTSFVEPGSVMTHGLYLAIKAEVQAPFQRLLRCSCDSEPLCAEALKTVRSILSWSIDINFPRELLAAVYSLMPLSNFPAAFSCHYGYRIVTELLADLLEESIRVALEIQMVTGTSGDAAQSTDRHSCTAHYQNVARCRRLILLGRFSKNIADGLALDVGDPFFAAVSNVCVKPSSRAGTKMASVEDAILSFLFWSLTVTPNQVGPDELADEESLKSAIFMSQALTDKRKFLARLQRVVADVMVLKLATHSSASATYASDFKRLHNFGDIVVALYREEVSTIKQLLHQFPSAVGLAQSFHFMTDNHALGQAGSAMIPSGQSSLNPLVLGAMRWMNYPGWVLRSFPPDVDAERRSFEKFYQLHYPLRRIIWLLTGGEPAVFVIDFPHGSKRVRSTADIFVLLSTISSSCNGLCHGISFAELSTRTGIPVSRIVSLLQPLTSPRLQMLTARQGAEEDHTRRLLAINPDFTSAKAEIRLNRSPLPRRCSGGDDAPDTQLDLMVLTTIVQVMKEKRECLFTELRSAVSKKIESQAVLTNRIFKTAFDECIARRYVARGADREMCVYLA